jgi:lambda repressor-like predicted transcriptional regulator
MVSRRDGERQAAHVARYTLVNATFAPYYPFTAAIATVLGVHPQ